MSDEFDPVEAIREGASIVEGLGPDAGFPHNEERWVAAMLRGADRADVILDAHGRNELEVRLDAVARAPRPSDPGEVQP